MPICSFQVPWSATPFILLLYFSNSVQPFLVYKAETELSQLQLMYPSFHFTWSSTSCVQKGLHDRQDFFSYCVCVQEPCPRHNQDTVAKICMIQLGNFALLICEGARFSNACMDATTAFRTSGCSCITAGDPITRSSSSSLFPSNNAFDSSPSTASTKSLPVAIAPVSWHGKETRQSNAANVWPPLRLWMWTLFAEETIKA